MTKQDREHIILIARKHLGVAQFGSVLEWGSRGRRFESSHPDHQTDLQWQAGFLFVRKMLAAGSFNPTEICILGVLLGRNLHIILTSYRCNDIIHDVCEKLVD